MRRPYYLKSRRRWYFKAKKDDGSLTQIELGRTKAKAYETWRRMTEGQPGGGNSTTVLEIIGLHLEHLKERSALRRIEPKTVKTKVGRIKPFILWLSKHHAGIAIDDLKQHHVSTWLASQTKWGPTTRHDAVADLKQVMKWGVTQGRIRSNPLEGMREEKGTPRDFEIDRKLYGRIIQNVGGSKFAGRHVRTFRLYLMALWLSGCRPSEIRRVKIEKCSDRRWIIDRHKNRKKTKRPRKVFLSPCLQTLTAIAANGRTSGRLFRPVGGRRWTYEDTKKRFYRMKSKKGSGVGEKCVMYSFRHTWITNAMLAGQDVGTVAALAGTSIRMISENYGHLSNHESHLEEAVDRIAKHQSGGR